MTTLFILADYYFPSSRAGGPVRSLETRVKRSKLDIELVCLDHDHLSRERFPPPFRGTTRLHGILGHYIRDLSRGGAIDMLRLRSRLEASDAIWLQSLYSVQFAILPLLWMCLRRRLDRVMVSPRGSLAPGAHGQGSRLKPWWDHVCKLLRIDQKVTWIASGESERADILRNFPRARVEISTETSVSHGLPLVGRRRSGNLRVLFLGRLSRTKGLLEAIRMVGLMREPATLIVAGVPEHDDYVRSAEIEARSIRPPASVEWLGHVSADGIVELIRSVDVLLSPTLGENFGHSIAECLGLGRPVFVTDSTPWSFADGTGAVQLINNCDLPGGALLLDQYASYDAVQVEQAQVTAYQVGQLGLPASKTIDELCTQLVEERLHRSPGSRQEPRPSRLLRNRMLGRS